MSYFLSVIIPTKDRGQVFFDTLASLEESVKNIPSEIIVVNDSNSSLTLTSTKVKVFQNPKNGVASARNYGFSQSKGDLILFLDDDMLVNEHVVLKIMDYTINNTNSLCLPNWTYPLKSYENLEKSKFGRFLIHIGYDSLKGWLQSSNEWKSDSTIFEHKGLASYFLMLKRNDFIALGGYDDRMPLAGAEDHDLSIRFKKKGFSFFIEPTVSIYHNELDRLTQDSWLMRKRRAALTNRVAFELGYQELYINYGKLKQMGILVINFFMPISTFIMKLLPNHTFFDFVYRKLMNLLILCTIYKGYVIDFKKYKNGYFK